MPTFNQLLTGGVAVLRERASDCGSLPALVKAYASNGEQSIERAQDLVARFADLSGSVVDDLIAERRAENAEEEIGEIPLRNRTKG